MNLSKCLFITFTVLALPSFLAAQVDIIEPYSQPCLPDGITFYYQSDVDNFQVNYPDCNEILGTVEISGPVISNLNGLSVVTSIGGDLIIYNAEGLTSLTGLENLSSIAGCLCVSDNEDLVNVNGLENLYSIGTYLHIGANEILIELSGLNNLTTVAGNVIIDDNPSLISLAGLENLNSIGGRLYIHTNEALTSLAEMENLTSIGDYLMIAYNYSLTSLAGLENLHSIGGNLSIHHCSSLKNLTGLEDLASIGDYLHIVGNDSLVNLSGLANLSSIGTYLDIVANNVLTSPEGLENLTSMNGELTVINNNALSNLEGLDNIEAGSINNLFLYNNPNLSVCHIQSICNFLETPVGTVDIHGNAAGCNDAEEIKTNCRSASEENITLNNGLYIQPNPSSGLIMISTAVLPEVNFEVNIYNLSGQSILSFQITEQHTMADISALPAGIYLVKVISDHALYTGKFVKK